MDHFYVAGTLIHSWFQYVPSLRLLKVVCVLRLTWGCSRNNRGGVKSKLPCGGTIKADFAINQWQRRFYPVRLVKRSSSIHQKDHNCRIHSLQDPYDKWIRFILCGCGIDCLPCPSNNPTQNSEDRRTAPGSRTPWPTERCSWRGEDDKLLPPPRRKDGAGCICNGKFIITLSRDFYTHFTTMDHAVDLTIRGLQNVPVSRETNEMSNNKFLPDTHHHY